LSSLQTPCTISPSASNDTPVSPQQSSAPEKETPQENPDSVEPIRQAVNPPQERVDKRKVSASPRSLPLPGLRTLHKPYSVKWTRARLQDAKPERVIGILHAWIHPRRYQEATPEVIADVRGPSVLPIRMFSCLDHRVITTSSVRHSIVIILDHS
jgi:hypothetical protein